MWISGGSNLDSMPIKQNHGKSNLHRGKSTARKLAALQVFHFQLSLLRLAAACGPPQNLPRHSPGSPWLLLRSCYRRLWLRSLSASLRFERLRSLQRLRGLQKHLT